MKIAMALLSLVFVMPLYAGTKKVSTSSYSANLFYRNTSGEVVSMGSTSGTFVNSSGENIIVETSKQSFITEGGVGSGRYGGHCADLDPADSPIVKAKLTGPIVKAMMLEATPSVWRAKETEKEVSSLVEKLTANMEVVNFSASYCAHNFVKDDDFRKETIRLQDKDGAGLKLEIKISRSLGKRKVTVKDTESNW